MVCRKEIPMGLEWIPVRGPLHPIGRVCVRERQMKVVRRGVLSRINSFPERRSPTPARWIICGKDGLHSVPNFSCFSLTQGRARHSVRAGRGAACRLG